MQTILADALYYRRGLLQIRQHRTRGQHSRLRNEVRYLKDTNNNLQILFLQNYKSKVDILFLCSVLICFIG